MDLILIAIAGTAITLGLGAMLAPEPKRVPAKANARPEGRDRR